MSATQSHRAALVAARARLARAHDDVLAMAREMRAIYSAEVMHKHLTQKALALSTPVCWQLEDLTAYYATDSPEALLLERRKVARPPDIVVASLPLRLLERCDDSAFVDVDAVESTDRGEGGFGSTGW